MQETLRFSLPTRLLWSSCSSSKAEVQLSVGKHMAQQTAQTSSRCRTLFSTEYSLTYLRTRIVGQSFKNWVDIHPTTLFPQFCFFTALFTHVGKLLCKRPQFSN